MSDLGPVTKSIVVNAGADAAFDHFTAQIGQWWPLATHCRSAGVHGAPAKTCLMEGKVGGRVYEVAPTGEEYLWGTVLAWEPGARVVWSWHLGRPAEEATEIEVTFTDAGVGKTRVDLEHRNWDRLADDAAEARGSYNGGWDVVFTERYGGFVAAAAA